ncbi:hypothetical protein GGS24DRAFT_467822 [Hypoxylon argillaceum]|nr:hypothetical protein GGS24DRAFT_467822 [Hypoxylon argillaceum]
MLCRNTILARRALTYPSTLLVSRSFPMTNMQYLIPTLTLDLASKTSGRENSQSHPSTAFVAFFTATTPPTLLAHATNFARSYRANILTVLEIPTLLNVLPYLDIGHGKCLDWAPHRTVTAELPGIYDGAKTPSKFWCFATSVANRNAW